MHITASGIVHGSVVEFDQPLPIPDGCRVRVVLELEEAVLAQLQLTDEEHRKLFTQWVESGPQGPIDEDDMAWP